jgi:predicted histidine transporter YuiF (NhaC family)
VLVDYLSRRTGRTVTTLVVVIGISGGLGDSCPPASSSSEETGVLDDGTMLVHKGLVGFVC